MTSIESSGWPLVFRVRGDRSRADSRMAENDSSMRLQLRALEGMQKEAVVSIAGDATWRLVCDEGPYLNGTDLAPFPLAFFTTGQQFCLLSEIVHVARQRRIHFTSLQIHQDNYYEMSGSFLRGDAIGGAMSPDVHVYFDTKAPAAAIVELIDTASSRSAGHALVRESIHNRFTLTLNGQRVPIPTLEACDENDVADPQMQLDAIEPEDDFSAPEGIISKTKSADRLEGVEGGVGSSLKAEQRRTLHVHGEAKLNDGMRMETQIQLLKPIGSNFRFLGDETQARGGDQTAPAPLAYLSAGIGFCFLTQIGRYAHIARQPLSSYRMVQDNRFRVPAENSGDTTAMVQPVETHVFLDGEMNEAEAGKFVQVGERTCFLHAAMRGINPPNITVHVNGRKVSP